MNKRLNYFLAFITLFAGSAALISAQTTNVIPSNLFLTDDGKLFWYQHGQRLVDIRRIQSAQTNGECQIAEQDINGNWGSPVAGLQLSLRFKTTIFTNKAPIVGIILLRNVTNAPLKFTRANILGRPSPINISMRMNGVVVSLKHDTGVINVISANETTIYPQTQVRCVVRLNDYYEFTRGGTYVITAELIDGGTHFKSKDVTIQVE